MSSETITYKGHQINKQTYSRSVEIVSNHIENINQAEYDELMGGYGDDLNAYIGEMILETCKVLSGNDTNLTSTDSLPQVRSELKETLRKANLNYFIDDVFGERVDMSWHHVEWGNMAGKPQNIALLAARDHGKSFFWSHLYPIWQMYRYDPNSLIHRRGNKDKGFLFSHTEDKAAGFLSDIKSSIEEIPMLREKMLPRGAKGWADTKIKTKNGCELRAKGFMAAARGFHPSFVICDDVLKDDSLFSPAQRNKAIHIFKSVVMQMLVPDGQLVVVGTPFHEMDLYHLFRSEEFEDWLYREYPSIYPNGDILWEARYNFERLMKRKKQLGVVDFSRELLCRPIASEASLFPYKALRTSIAGMENYKLINNIEASPIQFDTVVVGCDFATSANIGADYTVFTVWGIDSQENMWLLFMFRKVGATFNEQIGMIRTINSNFRPHLFVLENNNFQTLYQQNLLDSSIPIKGHTTTGQKNDLKFGLPSLAILFERGKIKLPYGDERSKNAAEVIMQEFNSVTFTDKGLKSVSGHDDTCMSTWFGRIAVSLQKSGGFKFEFI